MFSAGTKFTFGNIGKSAGFSFISSGGQEVPKTMLEDTFRYFGETAFEHILKGGVKQNAQSFSSDWMKKAAEKAVAEEFIQYSSKKFPWDLEVSVSKGVLNLGLNAPGPVPFPENLSADKALNECRYLFDRNRRRDHHMFGYY